ncbi:Phosphonate ABC transporter phosphate-binding periplasmic component [Candidatus Terasakiella magnetica]|uniref:Phosphonate ABC transporter phosphate-binding periplasmic component n=1 Tax=Candidatus Terasakiella magnetica TaxID=1867952 RepID=A0A1C3RKD3_9PROT|nr:phosphate/phosphite/phosphonate ABC transporter substrate-binding protein [Candidatus Terasakiella magnetica]SCA57717.1 Phosphonate ABC transporter phosphate-binding periplasmic component [Candidatus Terasakiella magnetica]
MKKIICSMVFLVGLQIQAAQAETQTFTFGFVPQQSAKVLVQKWGPILRYLSEETGYKLKFRTASKIPEFEKRVRNGDYDFSYMNPIHYTVFAKEPGYRAFAKQKGKMIKGILVVRKDATLKELEELSGNTLAFPAPAAFAASVLPRGSLSGAGVSFIPKYVGSHDSVYHGVAKGLYVAGGGIQRTFGTVKPEIGKQLRVLWTTKGYTPHAFASHPRIPQEVVSKIQKAFVEMFNAPSARKLLMAIGFKKGAEAAVNKDWDDVRGLGFTELPR